MSNAQPTDAIRLDLTKALALLPETLQYTDTGKSITLQTADLPAIIGAPILRRKDTGDAAYHLTCTHDDALQGITHIIRGKDVAPLTPIHVILQNLMGWPTPIYQHHGLITDDTGKRLAKIDKSKSIASYRAGGATPTDIRRMVGLPISPV
jgi:glutamyl-Q tRNA(Asp) synthetase